MSIAQQLIPITIPMYIRTKRDVALNVVNSSCHKLKTPTGHMGGQIMGKKSD